MNKLEYDEDVFDNLADYVEFNVNNFNDNNCWPWFFNKSTRYSFCGKVLTHRLAYEIRYGLIPIDKEIDHLCRNTFCWNPNHLEAVSHSENIMRGDLFLRKKTHCPKGHEYTLENTLLRQRKNNRQSRACRACLRMWKKQWLLRQS